MKVVTLQDQNFRQIPETLRLIADQIEAGDFGVVGEVALVVMGDTTEVFGVGPRSDGSSTACMLMAGAMRLVGAVESHGR